MDDMELTLLSEGILGLELDVLNQYGTRCAVTDFAILLGASVDDNLYVDDDSSLKGRASWWYLSSAFRNGSVRIVDAEGYCSWTAASARWRAIRPVLKAPDLFSKITKDRIKGYNGVEEVEYGEYPQYVVDSRLGSLLDREFSAGWLRKTGKTYTTDSIRWSDFSKKFDPVEHEEFEYGGKRYVRVKSNCYEGGYKLSNGVNVMPNDIVWLEVSPIKWLVDESSRMLVSKTLLAGGLRFCNDGEYEGDFKNTEMYMFLNKYFAKDMLPSVINEMTEEEKKEYERKRNPYKFNLENVSEEQIIKGSIKSDIPVFLHGKSSEGKSARIKEIDPDCIILYLRNATPDSLNGKSVYDSEKGEMIDIKPSWLKKLEEKCEKEPDKLHILFLDELTNALPSIQGMAFNIILDKEVNGIWKLPDNARIVAAGNEMNDSISANQMAEPLFNRFAHVYIKTTPKSWLEWASKNNIHPAIYSFVAYQNGEVLRSKYNGEKPNADPRKWEMASNMLYATGQPDMLRSLVGEDITKEFIQFCNQQVITLEDIINGDYSDKEIESLNTAERYATVMSLSQVDETNLGIVRDFVTKLGKEYISIFDSLWTHGDETKLEILAETKLADTIKR